MSIPKPKNLYVEEEMSFADKLKLAQKMVSESKQTVPPPPKPIEPQPARQFSYEKPPGWNKRKRRTPFIKVFWWGITRQIMQNPSDQRRYDKFIDVVLPGFLITVTALVMIGGYVFFTKTDHNSARGDSFIDKSINWITDTYDRWTGYTKDASQVPVVVPVDTAMRRVDTAVVVPKLITDDLKLPTTQKEEEAPINIVETAFKQPAPTKDTVVVKAPTPKSATLVIPTKPADDDNTKIKLVLFIRTLPQLQDFGGTDWSRLSQDEDDEYRWTLERANGSSYHFTFDVSTRAFKLN